MRTDSDQEACMGFRILGTGSAVPEKILTNDDLSTMVETSDEWITTRVGVKERRIAASETTSSLAAEAARRALESSGVAPEALDLILCATITADNVSPTAAGEVQEALGAVCPAFDVSSACSGFLFALETAAGFFARGTVKKALVIGAERISKLLDWTDRSTCVIFGDGAGAAVLGASEEDAYLVSELHTAGGKDVIQIPAYAGQSPFRIPPENGSFSEGSLSFGTVSHAEGAADLRRSARLPVAGRMARKGEKEGETDPPGAGCEPRQRGASCRQCIQTCIMLPQMLCWICYQID